MNENINNLIQNEIAMTEQTLLEVCPISVVEIMKARVRNSLSSAYEEGKTAGNSCNHSEIHGLYDQVKFERDAAIMTLHELGYELGVSPAIIRSELRAAALNDLKTEVVNQLNSHLYDLTDEQIESVKNLIDMIADNIIVMEGVF